MPVFQRELAIMAHEFKMFEGFFMGSGLSRNMGEFMETNKMKNDSLRGLTLVEVAITIAILSIVIIGVSRTFFAVHRASLNSRMQIRASRLTDMIQARYSNMYFGYVVPVDSRLPNFGLPAGATYPTYSTQAVPGSSIAAGWATTVAFSTWLPQTPVYPELEVLNEIQREVRAAGFSDFVVGVTPMRRDLTATTGMTSALVPFLDVAPADGIDDADPGIGFQDLNGDGDQVDFFWINDFFYTSERPNTHIVQLDIGLLKKDQTVVSKRGQLLTLEALGGGNVDRSPFSEEAAYGVALLNMPSTATVTLFDMNGPVAGGIRAGEATDQAFAGMAGFPGLPAVPFAYPSHVLTVRADTDPGGAVPIRFVGWTEPSATVEVRVAPNGALAPTDTGTADMLGNFNFPAPNLNAGLLLGLNRFALRAVKGFDISPFITRTVIKDDRGPAFSALNPPDDPATGLGTLTPFVQMTLLDRIPASTDVVSGVCPESVTLVAHKVGFNWSVKTSDYDPATGRVLWVDPVTLLPATMENGANYEWKIQGGDRAGYKIRTTAPGVYWRFKTVLPGVDGSPPNVTINPPTVVGGMVTFSADLQDNQSGVNLNTFKLRLGPDGGPYALVLDGAATPGIGRFFSKKPVPPPPNLLGALFNYGHPTALPSGTYRVIVEVNNHKAGSGSDFKVFVVP